MGSGGRRACGTGFRGRAGIPLSFGAMTTPTCLPVGSVPAA